MRRLVLLGSAVTLAACALPAQAGGQPGPYGRGARLPPEIAYRDPTYLPPPRFRQMVAVPVVVAPRNLALPLYNEPPPRFLVP
ncbi:hypothetical protein [Methylobacterium sp.]|jgi:hypothetical protein|uniref:hypothetical protein n=1 Tax=Methylobacterium sp. TaxID=409 RepID=UPI0026240489|nr:hypothetical protein [Methylobacterium sp.]MDB5645401.1 hypothetical protein [Methylobacterium sp.]